MGNHPNHQTTHWAPPIRDPNIIHLNIALQIVVSHYFGGKSHVSIGENVSFEEPELGEKLSQGEPGLLHWPHLRARCPRRESSVAFTAPETKR